MHDDYLVTASGNYFERNRRWLLPMLAALVVLAADSWKTLEAHGEASSLALLFAAIAVGLAGVGAQLTDTLSARFIVYFAPLAVMAWIVVAVLKSLA